MTYLIKFTLKQIKMNIKEFLKEFRKVVKYYDWYLDGYEIGYIRGINKISKKVVCPIIVVYNKKFKKYRSPGSFVQCGIKLGLSENLCFKIMEEADNVITAKKKLRKQLLKITGLSCIN